MSAGMHGATRTRRLVEAGLGRRRRKEKLFRLSGLVATAVGIVFLGVFFADLIGKGSSAFVQTPEQMHAATYPCCADQAHVLCDSKPSEKSSPIPTIR